jgi:hypothetical protein
MDILEISDIRVTARVYAHLAPGDLVAAVEALDRTPTGGCSFTFRFHVARNRRGESIEA